MSSSLTPCVDGRDLRLAGFFVHFRARCESPDALSDKVFVGGSYPRLCSLAGDRDGGLEYCCVKLLFGLYCRAGGALVK